MFNLKQSESSDLDCHAHCIMSQCTLALSLNTTTNAGTISAFFKTVKHLLHLPYDILFIAITSEKFELVFM